jgi:hypothetical protein
VYIIAALLMLVALVGLHTLQGNNYGRTGRGGFWALERYDVVEKF